MPAAAIPRASTGRKATALSRLVCRAVQRGCAGSSCISTGLTPSLPASCALQPAYVPFHGDRFEVLPRGVECLGRKVGFARARRALHDSRFIAVKMAGDVEQAGQGAGSAQQGTEYRHLQIAGDIADQAD